APKRHWLPEYCAQPVTGCTTPIFTDLAAFTMYGKLKFPAATTTVPAATVLMNSRRVFVLTIFDIVTFLIRDY
ncbi:MAG: hypothetical protein VB584_02705, partial [Candidatus Nitrosopelagicus sp.]